MALKKESTSKKDVYKNTKDSYEDISEKKTSKLGYLLLIVMGFFILGVGQTIFSDLRKIPNEPVHPSYCILNIVQNFKNLNVLPCVDSYKVDYDIKYDKTVSVFEFNETDSKFQLDKKYNNIEPQLKELTVLNYKIESNNSNINSLEYKIDKLNKEYDLSLQEKISDEDPLMNKELIKIQIVSLRSEVDILSNENADLEVRRNFVISQISPQVQVIGQEYRKAVLYYENVKSWYEFKVFLLMLIFIAPFFAVSVYYYLRLKRKNSPHTIILTATTTVFGILFLQAVSVFLYEILPREWFLKLFNIFLSVPFLRYVIYYGSVILVVTIFGSVVYYIQKRVFNPQKVAIRRLKDNKCPSCSFRLDKNHNYCPDCGLQLKEKCGNCKQLKIRYLSHCPNCGKE